MYSTAQVRGLSFDAAGGKYADVTWLLGVAARGDIVWIVEPLMMYRLHAGNMGKEESVADRLKLFAYLKKHASTLGKGLIGDFRFFMYKKLIELHRKNVRELSSSRQRTMRAYLAKYRCLRFARLDHHGFFLQKMKVRLLQCVRSRALKFPHGAA